jgi:hypothetical protein
LLTAGLNVIGGLALLAQARRHRDGHLCKAIRVTGDSQNG